MADNLRPHGHDEDVDAVGCRCWWIPAINHERTLAISRDDNYWGTNLTAFGANKAVSRSNNLVYALHNEPTVTAVGFVIVPVIISDFCMFHFFVQKVF